VAASTTVSGGSAAPAEVLLRADLVRTWLKRRKLNVKASFESSIPHLISHSQFQAFSTWVA